jgi:hypothetical protein
MTLDPLNEYLALEKRRGQSVRLPISCTNIDSAIKTSSMSPKDGDLLKIFYFAIGSPESLVAVQEIFKAQRTILAGKEFGGGYELYPADPVKAIEGIGPNIAYLFLRRRCHVYWLFGDLSTGSRRISDSSVVNTMQSISEASS